MTEKTKEFLQKLKDSGNYNNDYDYSKVEYIDSKTNVIVIFKKFNTEHLINPKSLINGVKCSALNVKEYLPFNNLKKIVAEAGVKTSGEYLEWFRRGVAPNIPSKPYRCYENSGWVSWYDFLSTQKGVEKRKKKDWVDYYSFCEFIRELKINSNISWRAYKKNNVLPINIPSEPDKVYKNLGWTSWGDCLNTDNFFTKDFISFKEAHEIIISLKIYDNSDTHIWNKWNEFCKINRKFLINKSIPTNPDKVYKADGWISMFHWLTGDIKTSTLPFDEAREYVRSLNLKNQKEWLDYTKSGDKPENIPATPQTVYKSSWINLSDWLGSDGIRGIDMDFMSYDEAKKVIHAKKFKSVIQFIKWSRSGDYDKLIPKTPNHVYKNRFNSWVSWSDFLGCNIIASQNMEFIPYNEAKQQVHKINLKTADEYRKWLSETKPFGIPTNPNRAYRDEWVSWADWLGYLGNGEHQWTKKYLINFVKSLQNELNNLDSVELITIINSNNLAKKIREIGSLEDLVSTQGGTQERANLVNNIINQLEQTTDETTTEEPVGTQEFEETLTEGSVSEITEDEGELELEPLNPIQELRMYDNNMITASLDDENIDFLMKNQLKKLWNRVLNNKVDINEYRNETGGEKFTIIKNWFFDEYEKVIRIESPSDYIFKYEPNLMQKLITYRLISEKRYGNWSGTGAGKTLSAIFAGRYAGAKNTLIICNNATVEGWVNSIHEYFSNNKVYTKKFLDYTDPKSYSIIDKYNVNFVDGLNNYLILNYETFQLEDGEYIVSELLKNNYIDYIILDEVQNVKQRDDAESTRRNVVSKLIIHSKEKNENLLVMAMSATPVINNLTEPKKLIELLTGEIHNELETDENILNGIEMYKALTRHGLRFKPNYGINVNEEIIEIDGESLIEQIIRIPRGAVVDFEKVLIETKLNGVKDKIKKGTLIYTHYVTELSHLIGEYVKDLGFSIGYYTGDDKSGLRPFKEGKIDVLIGSAPIGTGVDGIQYVCNTLIPIVLPWTSSEYDQLVGRVNRQGSKFKDVNIYIPQVYINVEDGIWSWDKRRHNIIRFKATLADLAVDGRVPRNLLPSKTRLIEDAKKELTDWVNRLNGGDMITFEREELMIPLNPKLFERNRTQLGDFSNLNKRWSVSRSDNTHERLKQDPSEWYYYHTLYSEKRKSWLEIPYVEIAKKINVRPDWVVGDFGCGENLLSKEIKNQVYAFDHVAIDDTVYSCDIKNVPIEDGILDVAVFSLSLMGSNYADYFKEAYRTLKTYGNIFVCEPASKWEGREDDLKTYIESVGFKCFGTVKNTDKFIYIDGIKY